MNFAKRFHFYFTFSALNKLCQMKNFSWSLSSLNIPGLPSVNVYWRMLSVWEGWVYGSPFKMGFSFFSLFSFSLPQKEMTIFIFHFLKPFIILCFIFHSFLSLKNKKCFSTFLYFNYLQNKVYTFIILLYYILIKCWYYCLE